MTAVEPHNQHPNQHWLGGVANAAKRKAFISQILARFAYHGYHSPVKTILPFVRRITSR